MTQDNSLYRFVFTLFDDFNVVDKTKQISTSVRGVVTSEQLVVFLQEYSKKWSFQQEHTLEKRVHFQGRFSLKTKKTKKQMLLIFYHWVLNNGHTVEIAKAWLTALTINPEKDEEKSFKYSKKDESRLPGTFRCYPPIYDGGDVEMMSTTDPRYKWQGQLDRLLTTTKSDRTVIVVYDPVGGCGKTKWIKRQLFYNQEAQYLSIDSTISQTLAAIAAGPGKQLFLIDVPRATRSKESWFALFSLCEQLKNGLVSSTFYGKYNINLFAPATIVLMTNYDIGSNEEFMAQLTSDRWHICSIKRYPFTNERTLTNFHEDAIYDESSRTFPGIG